MCSDPPASAAWRHEDARDGFEIAFFRTTDGGLQIDGATTALEGGDSWVVGYAIALDPAGRTRSAEITARSARGPAAVRLESDGSGHWLLDGRPAPHLEGCLDVDLESSAMTNALPVRRMGLAVGARASSPAAYVRAGDLAVERLEQSYARADDDGACQRYDYSAPAFDVACRLVYDSSGLPVAYPGLASRSG